MKKVLFAGITLFLLSTHIFADYKAPEIRIHLSQEKVSSLLKFAANRWLTDVDLELLPIENRFVLKGRIKGDAYTYLPFSAPYFDRDYPNGILFQLKFQVEILGNHFIRLGFDRLSFFEETPYNFVERSPAIVIYDRPHGQPHLVTETLLALLQLISLENYLLPLSPPSRTPAMQYFLFEEDASMTFQLQPHVFSQFLPHPKLDTLELWALEPIIDTDMKKIALEIAMGSGDRSSFKRIVIDTRRKTFRAFHPPQTPTPYHMKYFISVDGLNSLLEAGMPILNDEEALKEFEADKEEGFLIQKVKVDMYHDPKVQSLEPLQSALRIELQSKAWDAKGNGWKFWQTRYEEAIQNYVFEARFHAKDENELIGELTYLDAEWIQLNEGKISWLKFLTKWIIPRFDDPNDDNETINQFVKLGITEKNNLLIHLNRRISLPWADFLINKVWMRHREKEFMMMGDIIFPITDFHLLQLGTYRKKAEAIPTYKNDMDQFLFLNDQTTSLYEKYSQTTVTGIDHQWFLVSYATLYAAIRTFDAPDLNSLAMDIRNTKIQPLLNTYETQYRKRNLHILESKTMWTKHVYEDAKTAEDLYQKILILIQNQ